MRLAFCISVKNRSCVIVDKEDSLSFLQHVAEHMIECPEFSIEPWKTKQDQIILPLLPRMIKSLLENKKPDDDWVLVVVDYKSSDVNVKEMLECEVGDKMPWHLETVEDYPFFDRGGGLGKAAEIAESRFQAEALFFCDADLLFTKRDVIERAIDSVKQNHFYYPIVFSFALADHSKGYWRDTGYGIFACKTEDYKGTDGWCHNVSWGWEDRALADSIPDTRKDREKVAGYFHQWHPLQWEFRVKEYPIKEFLFKDAAVKRV